MKQPAKKTAKPASKPKPKAKPKLKAEKPIEPKWGKPEKMDVPKTYLEGTAPSDKPKKLSNQEFLDMVKTRTLINNGKLKTMTNEEYMEMGRKLVQSEENERRKHKAEKIAIYAVIAFVVMFLFWCWSYSDAKNEIKRMERVQEEYQYQVDSLNQVIGELQANLQIQLDTIHNNSSKIPQ